MFFIPEVGNMVVRMEEVRRARQGTVADISYVLQATRQLCPPT